MDSNVDALNECSAATLRRYYNENDCCIVNLAECNYIERAWWVHVNVLRHRPLCIYPSLRLGHPQRKKHVARRRLFKRIKQRSRLAAGGRGSLSILRQSIA